ncbi:hypothetical protein CY34DRAFT_472279 [Suillus luteus UH-Slu-Lm8-n1]|uniref:Uncharacterized protein n=1 Tax=Suillus luteus UH-Slu-Lm8-n1 TaxID=930992 RepID=A0A0D0BSI1_9AGAM|nr:hypothetical protein CY34DRAFT_472279 [Suillus luteus UH-Slu-Lm8-n1]
MFPVTSGFPSNPYPGVLAGGSNMPSYVVSSIISHRGFIQQRISSASNGDADSGCGRRTSAANTAAVNLVPRSNPHMLLRALYHPDHLSARCKWVANVAWTAWTPLKNLNRCSRC